MDQTISSREMLCALKARCASPAQGDRLAAKVESIRESIRQGRPLVSVEAMDEVQTIYDGLSSARKAANGLILEAP